MKKYFVFLTAVACLLGLNSLKAADFTVGFVNFKACIEQSKQGQQEKNAFEAMKKQMTDTLEKTDKELQTLAKQLDDQDYMDGLSPTAEEELKTKYQALAQEMQRFQGQFYQLLNQANYKMLQTMHDEVSSAAEQVRAKHKLSIILNEESTFAYSTSLDYTEQVVEVMNSHFDKEIESVAGLDRESSKNG